MISALLAGCCNLARDFKAKENAQTETLYYHAQNKRVELTTALLEKMTQQEGREKKKRNKVIKERQKVTEATVEGRGRREQRQKATKTNR